MTSRATTLTAALVLLASCADLFARDDDEVRFKSKSYTPRNTAESKAYTPNAYTPTASRSTGKPIEPPRTQSRWNIFGGGKASSNDKTLDDAKTAESKPYTVQQHISVPTIKPDPSSVAEKKPYQDPTDKLADGTYKPSDKPRDKNPLLKPRQGIKEPE